MLCPVIIAKVIGCEKPTTLITGAYSWNRLNRRKGVTISVKFIEGQHSLSKHGDLAVVQYNIVSIDTPLRSHVPATLPSSSRKQQPAKMNTSVVFTTKIILYSGTRQYLHLAGVAEWIMRRPWKPVAFMAAWVRIPFPAPIAQASHYACIHTWVLKNKHMVARARSPIRFLNPCKSQGFKQRFDSIPKRHKLKKCG